jgi:hypothetical protein
MDLVVEADLLLHYKRRLYGFRKNENLVDSLEKESAFFKKIPKERK